ncbi:MAG: BBP7 family outer membrane beta-barrel protein [Thermoguttaceae bacterium]|nr:BBP7 family outer membrane beta-barrel protein [Thermoguttaceae bacterium]
MLHNTLKTFVAAIVLMGLSICCTRAFAQISDAQIWDVQTANDYSGGHYENEGFFFGAEGLYWALPSPKSNVVGNENAEGATAYKLDWTVRNNSSQWFIVNNSSGDDDDDDDDDSGDDDDDNDNSGSGSSAGYNIVDADGSSSTVREAIVNGYTILGDENFKDLADDKYGPMGVVTMTTQHNSWNTDLLGTKFHVGQRYNFGFMNGHNGWECQVFTIGGNNNYSGQNVQVGFNDTITAPDGYGNNYLKGIILNTSAKDTWHDCHTESRFAYQVGGDDDDDGEIVQTQDLYVDRMLVQFNDAEMWDHIDTWGVELNYLHRAHATRIGMFELGLGVRYMKWNEEFGFWGGSNGSSGNGEIYTPNFLDDTSIKTEADNNLVGPQLGLRWSRNTGRFGMEILAKFTAAYNAQKITNSCILGSNGYVNGMWGPNSMYASTNNSTSDSDNDLNIKSVYYYAPNVGASGISGYAHQTYGTFTPVAELGIKFKFDLTSKINLSLGWSGIYAGNIARPGGMTDYSLDNTTGGSVLGINQDGDHKKNVFMHGFTFGITLNR